MQDETKLSLWWRGLHPSSRIGRQFHLDKFQPSPFLGINNINIPLKKGSSWYGWLTSGETSFKNDSITYFNDNSDNSILDYEGNACGVIAIPIIESNFDNDHIHVLHDPSKQYIYRYLISKLISLEATIQNMILQNIFLLLIWRDVNEIK